MDQAIKGYYLHQPSSHDIPQKVGQGLFTSFFEYCMSSNYVQIGLYQF